MPGNELAVELVTPDIAGLRQVAGALEAAGLGGDVQHDVTRYYSAESYASVAVQSCVEPPSVSLLFTHHNGNVFGAQGIQDVAGELSMTYLLKGENAPDYPTERRAQVTALARAASHLIGLKARHDNSSTKSHQHPLTPMSV